MHVNQDKQKSYLGYVFVLLAAFGAAIADVIPKPILGNYESNTFNISPILFVTIIFVINAVLFSIRKNQSVKIPKNHILALILAGIVEALGTILYYEGLRRTFASDASIISNSEIVFGVILIMVLFHETIKRKEIFPIILVLSGSVIIPVVMELEENSFSDVIL